MRLLLLAWLVLALEAFIFASGGYLLLQLWTGDAFGGLFRMHMYHVEHPFQYIGIVAIVFPYNLAGIVLGAMCLHYLPKKMVLILRTSAT